MSSEPREHQEQSTIASTSQSDPSTSKSAASTSKSVVDDIDISDASTQRAFSCGICFELYTRNARYPISLSCGHTFCFMCVRELGRNRPSITCGICRKHTFSDYKKIGKNFVLLEILEKTGLLEDDPPKQEELPIPHAVAIEDWYDNDDWNALIDFPVRVRDTSMRNTNGSGASFWPTDAEMETFYNMIEEIQDHMYGRFQTEQRAAATTARVQELAQIRDGVDTFETTVARERRSFHNLYNRARNLLMELQRLAPNGTDTVPAALRNQEDHRLTQRDRSWQTAFYDETDLLGGDDVPIISISIGFSPDYDNDRLDEHFLRREDNDFVRCYLCDVRFFNNNATSIPIHIHGRRHRDMLIANNNAELPEYDSWADLGLMDNILHSPFGDSTRSRRSLPTFRNDRTSGSHIEDYSVTVDLSSNATSNDNMEQGTSASFGNTNRNDSSSNSNMATASASNTNLLDTTSSNGRSRNSAEVSADPSDEVANSSGNVSDRMDNNRNRAFAPRFGNNGGFGRPHGRGGFSRNNNNNNNYRQHNSAPNSTSSSVQNNWINNPRGRIPAVANTSPRRTNNEFGRAQNLRNPSTWNRGGFGRGGGFGGQFFRDHPTHVNTGPRFVDFHNRNNHGRGGGSYNNNNSHNDDYVFRPRRFGHGRGRGFSNQHTVDDEW